jgi:class 3 adenylate cyclase
MEPREERVVLILADISGYTRFMVENQLSAVHGQIVITTLIETILREVDIPLRLQGIEGDAVFVYAEHPGSDDAWREVLAEISTKLLRFFEVFYAGAVTAIESTPCKCAICKNVEDLKLKVIVHSGRAVFNTIAGSPQISGTDVILAHRLLKNSIPSSEYLLLTESAYRDLGHQMPGKFIEGRESYDELGSVKTFVRYLGEAKERHRDAMYAMSRGKLALRAEGYVLWGAVGQFRAVIEQMRNPIVDVTWTRRAGFVLLLALSFPFTLIALLCGIPLKLLSRQAARGRAGSQAGI